MWRTGGGGIFACVTDRSHTPTALQSGRRQCPALDRLQSLPADLCALLPSHPQLVRAELLAEAEVWPHLPPLLLDVRIRANQRPRRPQVQQQRQGDGARAADALLAVDEHAAPARIGRVRVLPLDPLRALALLEGRGDVDLWQIGDANVMVAKVLWKEVRMLGALTCSGALPTSATYWIHIMWSAKRMPPMPPTAIVTLLLRQGNMATA